MDFDMFNIPVINLDYYAALGLKREDDPTIEDIQAAYRHLALQWHPERNKDIAKRETAALKFVEINEAYKVLMDKKQREAKQAAKAAKSKRKEERALSPRGTRVTSPIRALSPVHTGMTHARATSQPPTPTPNIKVDHVEEAEPSLASPVPPRSSVTSPTNHLSTSLPARSSRTPSPNGSRTPTQGAIRSPPLSEHHERGRTLERYEHTRTMSDITTSESSSSYATSISSATTNIPDDWLFPIHLSLEDLYTCRSQRFRVNRHLLSGASKEVFVDVSVQPDWRDGTKIRCKGLGNEREGQAPQDVTFVVKEKLHPRFLRDPVGYDIYARLEISLIVALGGGGGEGEALQIKGVDGREIVVEVPPAVVRHGSMTRIKGAGMPKYKSKDGSVPLRGDLLLEWCVLPPEKELSDEAMEELRQAIGPTWLQEEE